MAEVLFQDDRNQRNNYSVKFALAAKQNNAHTQKSR